MKPIFARVLNSLRRESGLSQKKAAQELGISQALLSHYENGVREPKLEFVLKVCDYYGVSSDYMLGRTEQKHMQWDMALNCENAEDQRCINAAVLINAILSEINDEQINSAVSRYLSYSIYFVLTALRSPTKPYEPLFDAAIKTAEADLINNVVRLNGNEANADAGLTDELLIEKYPKQHQAAAELDSFIEKALSGIRDQNKTNHY